MAFARKGRNLVQAPNNLSTLGTGDEVFLASGPYGYTLGIFVNLRAEPEWADILERNSQVRSHPVEWPEHAKLDPAI
jgi:hypothetical protein